MLGTSHRPKQCFYILIQYIDVFRDRKGVVMYKMKSICLFTVLSVAAVSATAGPKKESRYGRNIESHHQATSYQAQAVTSHVPVQSNGYVVHQQPNGHARSHGAYAGIGLGKSKLGVDGVGESFRDTNIRAYMGYDLNRYFAVEAGVGSVPLDDYLDNVGDLTGIDVSVLAKLPVTSRLSAYARLGYWDWDYSDSDKSKSHGFFGGTDMLYGLGLDYQVSPQFKLRLDAIRYEADDADLDTLMASIAYKW